jgi:hypothetical protein
LANTSPLERSAKTFSSHVVARSFLPNPQVDHRDVIRRDILLAGLRYELPQQLLSFGPFPETVYACARAETINELL